MNGDIKNSYATGSVEGSKGVGGLVGENLGDIKNSYASGQITRTSGAAATFGGLVGSNSGGGALNGKNYWRNDDLPFPSMDGVGAAVAAVDPASVIGQDDAELRALTAARASTGWSSAIWNFVPGKYPTLK